MQGLVRVLIITLMVLGVKARVAEEFTTKRSTPKEKAIPVSVNVSVPVYAVEVCDWNNGHKECRWELDPPSVNYPENYCGKNVDCTHCVRSWETKITLNDGTLVKPFEFRWDQQPSDKGRLELITCYQPGGHQCYCTSENPCNGTPDYCSEVPCDAHNPCHCGFTSATVDVWVRHPYGEVYNPSIISYQVCFFNNSIGPIARSENRIYTTGSRLSRRLKSVDETRVKTPKGTIIFKNPILFARGPGVILLRKSGLELSHILEKEGTNQYVVPDEFLLTSGTIKVVLVKNSGSLIEAEFKVAGRTFCSRLECLFCWQALYFRHCLTQEIRILLYFGFFIFFGLFLWYLKVILYTCWQGFRGVVAAGYIIYFGTKHGLRGSMILGYLVGENVRRLVRKAGRKIENAVQNLQVDQRRPLPVGMTTAVILLIGVGPFLIMDCSAACTSIEMLKSDNLECVEGPQGTECRLSKQAQITLPSLQSQTCIWFSNEKGEVVFHMTLEFKRVNCLWSHNLQYFTFPTELRSINEIQCPQSKFCSWREFCYRNYQFEGLTRESLSYPGVTDCVAGSKSSGCALIHTHPCHFLRWYLVGRLSHSYAVSKITSQACNPEIEITITNNATLERFTVNKQGIYRGVTINPLGTLYQPLDFVDKNLIVRVGHPDEAYIESASAQGRPQPGEIGDVQAEIINTQEFIFNEKSVTCRDFEETMTCEKMSSYLEQMTKKQINKLPLAWSNHYFSLDKDRRLTSTLLQSAPLVVHLIFADYKIHLGRRLVCPQIDKVVEISGCYSCHSLAEIIVRAKSTCLDGSVQVAFHDIFIATRTVTLTTEYTEVKILFRAEKACGDDEICLISHDAVSCESFSYCLNSPKVSLEQMEVESTRSRAPIAGNSWIGFIPFVSFFAHVPRTMKWVVVAVLTALSLAFGISLCITVFGRR